MDEIIRAVQKQVLSEMDLSRDISDEEVRVMITKATRETIGIRSVSLKERVFVENAVFNGLRRLDIIQELVEDEDVTEIMVNGPNHIFYERGGAIYQWNRKFESEEKLQDVVQRIVGNHNRSVNLASPIVDSRLDDGSRVNVVLSPVAINGTTLTIRKFPKEPMSMARLIELGSISEEAAEFLRIMVQAGRSIFVTGGTGSGKTTFLNALSEYIPSDERVITIEDSAELQLKGIKNLVRMETRGANNRQVEPITIRDLIKTALRMRPDRIIVGECRGGEAFDMLQAMNTGHDGSMSTGHANSCRDMVGRLEMMVKMGMDLPLSAIRAQIASGIDYLVHLSRMKDRSRRVMEIAKIEGVENGEVVLKTIFERKGERLCQIEI